MRENWFIETLVTHSSGVSRGIHHKCKRPLNPTKLYVSGWVESCRSVLIESHNMPCWLNVWYCAIIYDLMDEISCALAYPTFIVVCSVVWYSLLWWSSTCWCEQMQGTPAGNREVMVPRHNLHGLVLVSLVGFSLGLRPMYLFVLWLTYISL